MTTGRDQLLAYSVLTTAAPDLNPLVALDTLLIVNDLPHDTIVSLLAPATGKIAAREIADLVGSP